MVRSQAREHGAKVKVTISVDPELYEWAVSRTKPGGPSSSFSHAVEQALAALKKTEK